MKNPRLVSKNASAIVASAALIALAVAGQLQASTDPAAPEQTILTVEGEVQPPVRVLGMEPVYPPNARKDRVQGVVVVKAVIDRGGAVASAEALDESGTDNEELGEAAVAAIERWKFKPATLHGEAVAVYYNLTVNFRLDDSTEPQMRKIDRDVVLADPPADGRILSVAGDVKRPVRISGAAPQYTEKARKSRIEGRVVVLAIIDREGDVVSAKAVETVDEGLSRQAVLAIKDWKFKPATLHGEPVPVYYHLTVNFRLTKDGTKPSRS